MRETHELIASCMHPELKLQSFSALANARTIQCTSKAYFLICIFSLLMWMYQWKHAEGKYKNMKNYLNAQGKILKSMFHKICTFIIAEVTNFGKCLDTYTFGEQILQSLFILCNLKVGIFLYDYQRPNAGNSCKGLGPGPCPLPPPTSAAAPTHCDFVWKESCPV